MAKMSRMIMDKIVPYCEVWIDKVKFLIFVANLSFIKINVTSRIKFYFLFNLKNGF